MTSFSKTSNETELKHQALVARLDERLLKHSRTVSAKKATAVAVAVKIFQKAWDKAGNPNSGFWTTVKILGKSIPVMVTTPGAEEKFPKFLKPAHIAFASLPMSFSGMFMNGLPSKAIVIRGHSTNNSLYNRNFPSTLRHEITHAYDCLLGLIHSSMKSGVLKKLQEVLGYAGEAVSLGLGIKLLMSLVTSAVAAPSLMVSSLAISAVASAHILKKNKRPYGRNCV
jgi:hypothetical protein